VTGCHSHGDLLGGYVLGSLEPADMDEMHNHIEGCPLCAREERKLAGLPALLDTIEPEDVPPPELSPELEEVVLDRFVRERQEPAPVRPAAARWRRMPVLAAASGIAAALLVGLAVLLFGEDAGDTAYAWSSMKGRGAAADARAYARLTSVDAGTHVSLNARRLGRGEAYELWCVREDGRWVSGGTFKAGPDGRAAAELTAAVSPGDYHRIVVTRDALGAERGAAVLGGELSY
jgi:anti-sigma-K factor RskA